MSIEEVRAGVQRGSSAEAGRNPISFDKPAYGELTPNGDKFHLLDRPKRGGLAASLRERRSLTTGSRSSFRQRRAGQYACVASIQVDDETMFVQSWLEAQMLKRFHRDPRVNRVFAQPREFQVVLGGKVVSRRFDLLVHYKDGTVQLVAVRPHERIGPLEAELKEMLPQLADHAHALLLRTERHLDPVGRANGELIFTAQSYRDPDADASVAAYVEQMTDRVEIRQIVRALGFYGAYWAVLRAIGANILVQTTRGHITDLTTLEPASFGGPS